MLSFLIDVWRGVIYSSALDFHCMGKYLKNSGLYQDNVAPM